MGFHAYGIYDFRRPDIGLRVIARDNFYNWKFSVISERTIIADFTGLFHTTPPIDPSYTGSDISYFEGFPNELVFGHYEPSDKMKWSAEINGDHAAWTVAFLIMRALDQIQPFKWSTRP